MIARVFFGVIALSALSLPGGVWARDAQDTLAGIVQGTARYDHSVTSRALVPPPMSNTENSQSVIASALGGKLDSGRHRLAGVDAALTSRTILNPQARLAELIVGRSPERERLPTRPKAVLAAAELR